MVYVESVHEVYLFINHFDFQVNRLFSVSLLHVIYKLKVLIRLLTAT